MTPERLRELLVGRTIIEVEACQDVNNPYALTELCSLTLDNGMEIEVSGQGDMAYVEDCFVIMPEEAT